MPNSPILKPQVPNREGDSKDVTNTELKLLFLRPEVVVIWEGISLPFTKLYISGISEQYCSSGLLVPLVTLKDLSLITSNGFFSNLTIYQITAPCCMHSEIPDYQPFPAFHKLAAVSEV